MKHFAKFGIIALLLFKVAFAQSDEFVMTWPIVVAEAKKSDAEIKNPKKAQKLKTWTDRGRKYIEVYTFDLKSIYPGTPINQIVTHLRQSPKSQRKSGDYTVLAFDRVEFYFKDSVLAKYERIGNDVPAFFTDHATPLDIATEAYINAKKYDDKNKRGYFIGEQLKILIDLYTNEGLYAYGLKDYSSASEYFGKIAEIIALKYDNLHDTVRASTLYDCATVMRLAKNYKKAIQYYNLSYEFSPNPKVGTLYDIAVCQKENADTAAAINSLIQIIETYPNDEFIVGYTTELVQLYLQQNQYDNALEYLTKALEKEPTNTNFLFNIASLYETSGKYELATEYYKKALEINPNDEGSNLNMGVRYRNQAKKLLDEAEAAYGTKRYKKLFDDGKATLRLAIPYLEKYMEIIENKELTEPKEIYENLNAKINTYRDLISIYAQLDIKDKYAATKKKLDAALK